MIQVTLLCLANSKKLTQNFHPCKECQLKFHEMFIHTPYADCWSMQGMSVQGFMRCSYTHLMHIGACHFFWFNSMWITNQNRCKGQDMIISISQIVEFITSWRIVPWVICLFNVRIYFIQRCWHSHVCYNV